MGFGKGILETKIQILNLTRRNKNEIRFLTSKVDSSKGHWIKRDRNELRRCKGEKCYYCEKGIPAVTVYSTPVLDCATGQVVRLRLPITLLSILQAKEKSDPKFKKFYSRKHGRTLIIICKRVRTERGTLIDYQVYPGKHLAVSKKLLEKDPGHDCLFKRHEN